MESKGKDGKEANDREAPRVKANLLLILPGDRPPGMQGQQPSFSAC